VRFDAAKVTDFTDGEVAFGGYLGERILHENQQGRRECYEVTLRSHLM
jgi:hypothetical protein